MEKFVRTFWKEEDGNTTVDWMVLTAGLVLLGSAVMATIGSGSTDLAEDTSVAIESIDLATGV